MTSKNISIREDVYELLLRMKRGDESFSQTIRRLASARRISGCAGIWSGMSVEEEAAIREGVAEAKERANIALEARRQ